MFWDFSKNLNNLKNQNYRKYVVHRISFKKQYKEKSISENAAKLFSNVVLIFFVMQTSAFRIIFSWWVYSKIFWTLKKYRFFIISQNMILRKMLYSSWLKQNMFGQLCVKVKSVILDKQACYFI